MAKEEPPTKAGPESPSTWSQPKQYTRNAALGEEGRHVNRDVFRTPSGHSMSFVDDEGKESISVKHRSGAGFMIGPSGDVTMTSHNGSYHVVFGENRMEVTGTHDITVKGGGTLKVDGDYDCTIGGNMNMTVDNDMNFKGKNMNITSTGNIDMVGQNMTTKLAGSGAVHAEGGYAIAADGSVGLMSRGGSVAIAGASQVGIAAAGGEVAISSGGATHIQAAGNINMDGAEMHLNSGQSQAAADIVTGTAAAQPTAQARTSRLA